MKLWTNNFQWIFESNFWLCNSLYALLAGLPFVHMQDAHQSLVVATLCFAVGIWLPGIFSAFLMDRFKGKSLYLTALAGCILMTVPLPYLNGHPEALCLLRLLQGACYGLALNLGNTLSVDITSSPFRSKANGAFARIGRLGMLTALAGVCISYRLMGMQGIYFFSLATGVLALLCVFMVSVTFRAPIGVPVISLDRFFLKRTWPEAINLFFMAIVPGFLLTSSLAVKPQFYTSIKQWVPWMGFLVGMAIAFGLRHTLLQEKRSKVRVGIGLFLLIIGSLIVCEYNTVLTFPVGLFLIGAGIEFAAAEFLNLFIRLSHHCQRSTANASFLFSWETGCAVGACIGLHAPGGETILFSALIAFILYYGFTGRHYKRYKRRR